MKPEIRAASFGSITVRDQNYSHDILIRLDGSVEKRKKKLSKEKYGTSHKISLEEARHIYQEGADTLVIGTGMFDRVRLSDEAQAFFDQHHLKVLLAANPQAVKQWNEIHSRAIALFHITC